MTTIPAATEIPAPPADRFPDFPPRTDMMNTIHLHDYGIQPALRIHLGSPETTLALGEVPIYWYPTSDQTVALVPDLLVAFNIRRALVIEQKGYSINDQGKPPDLALEVASDGTTRNDEIAKWLDYARFGILEYWLFDPDWGLRYAAGLIGWKLVGDQYEPIIVRQFAPGMYYAWSEVLQLYACWEHGRLRWYDPATGRYLLSHDEERSRRIAAEAEIRRRQAELARRRAGGAGEA